MKRLFQRKFVIDLCWLIFGFIILGYAGYVTLTEDWIATQPAIGVLGITVAVTLALTTAGMRWRRRDNVRGCATNAASGK